MNEETAEERWQRFESYDRFVVTVNRYGTAILSPRPREPIANVRARRIGAGLPPDPPGRSRTLAELRAELEALRGRK